MLARLRLINVCSVNYLYGNIEYARKNWKLARRWYEDSLRIGLATSPIHPITTAAYYSLGSVELKLKNHDNARQVDRAEKTFHVWVGQTADTRVKIEPTWIRLLRLRNSVALTGMMEQSQEFCGRCQK